MLGNKEDRLIPFHTVGANPIVIGAMCNGVSEAVNQIIARAGNPSSLALVRFHGHGNKGVMGIAFGKRVLYDNQGKKTFIMPDDLSSFESRNLEKVKPYISKLRSVFGVFTCVELHGCRIASGDTGRQFIKNLAEIWGVPVSAGNEYQYSGNVANTFKFEGSVFTAFPYGKNIKAWSDSLPRLPEVCMP
jgi:hypothetical protein